jgi:hypothetical protein
MGHPGGGADALRALTLGKGQFPGCRGVDHDCAPKGKGMGLDPMPWFFDYLSIVRFFE